jgi:5-methylcytosine-specific restriction endonuclease McrA
MPRSAYTEYMQSPEWRSRRSLYFETHERRCKACGDAGSIQLHHKTYARLGEERDQDLVALCRRCHLNLHREQKKSGVNLWKATEDFIRKKKGRLKKVKTNRRQPIHTSKRKNNKNYANYKKSGK